ncbi:pentatricopeptide repeat-containing protein At5g04780, mitochondrial-like [Zingiber officinale]|uniref:pentatricopeptide repeat-containing protein At5g04780, mitochondrial-like n=1 Tax=Zingiber officinale TaxID=94328 RepID=UPI001C4B9C55|nr:pentatricopeptide repeat-containing protein At5g04780, mitochondrial-like [Zingiber officinale]
MPNQSTFVGLLSGCAHSGLIVLSKQFYAQVIVRGFGFNEVVQVMLVDMYAKYGDIESGRIAFDMSTVKQKVAIWNSLICGYGKHGRSLEALGVFDFMEFASVHPDHTTFTCLLLACSHSGWADDGRRLSCLMQKRYGVPSREEHYSCMVDLFGRAGMVKEAYELIIRSACKLGPSIQLSEKLSQKLFELEPECSGSYVALCNIYSVGKQWQANDVRELMDDWNISKDTSHSWIEVGGLVHNSTWNDENVLENALNIWKANNNNKDFKYMYVWRVLREYEKYVPQSVAHYSSKKTRTSESGGNTSTSNPDKSIGVDDSEVCIRSIGQKTEKRKNKSKVGDTMEQNINKE